MDVSTRKQFLILYGQASELLGKALKIFPKEMWKFKPSPAQWSIHEIIIHITDSEVSSYIRCRCFIAEPGKTIMAYDQDSWAVKLKYHERSTDESLALFGLLRNSSMEMIRNLQPEIWANTINHPEQGIITMDDWLETYANHIPFHINQMKRVFDAWKGSVKPL